MHKSWRVPSKVAALGANWHLRTVRRSDEPTVEALLGRAKEGVRGGRRQWRPPDDDARSNIERAEKGKTRTTGERAKPESTVGIGTHTHTHTPIHTEAYTHGSGNL